MANAILSAAARIFRIGFGVKVGPLLEFRSTLSKHWTKVLSADLTLMNSLPMKIGGIEMCESLRHFQLTP